MEKSSFLQLLSLLYPNRLTECDSLGKMSLFRLLLLLLVDCHPCSRQVSQLYIECIYSANIPLMTSVVSSLSRLVVVIFTHTRYHNLMTTLTKNESTAFYGMCFAIPLRKWYILKQKLVFPTVSLWSRFRIGNL